ncbi:Manganese transporter smf1 [Spiromyces aspiralis]|uniref:Manganese transporter smf1 n=1 Tax=Spiromyces aspiralis TaxID=68401 RepID=A0ACC1HWV1_9FUNG|nr:Manganese transporter smf1 [Spiromyces aspiralis]
MSSFVPTNPKPFLQELAGKPVFIKLKWGYGYRGSLESIDSYMNIKLVNVSEEKDGVPSEPLPGELLIRCNNVLYIQEVKSE